MLGLAPLFFLPAVAIVGVAVVAVRRDRAERTSIDLRDAPPVDADFLQRSVALPVVVGDLSGVDCETTLGGRLRSVTEAERRQAQADRPRNTPRLTVNRNPRRRAPLVAQR